MDNTNKSRLQIFLEETYEGCVMEYSGRGMYGKKCLAVTLDTPRECAPATLAAEIIRSAHSFDGADLSDIADLMENIHVDNLGKGSVCYWPGEEFVGDEEEDLEDA